jgi:FimV-like protein
MLTRRLAIPDPIGGRAVRRFLIACPVLVLAAAVLWAAEDTKKAAETRKKLQSKITVAFKEARFRDVEEELQDKVEGVRFREDTKGGVNLNAKVTYKADAKTLEDVLNGICDKMDLGWYIISKQGDAYDGTVYITRGKERGYPEGQGPKDKDKPKVEEKPKDKPKDKPAEDDADKAEKDAGRKLKLAKSLIDDGKGEQAKDILDEIVKKFGKTKAAEEAKELLKKLDK